MDTEHRYIRHKRGGAPQRVRQHAVHSCIFVENYSISIRVHVDVDVDVYNVDAVLREEKESCLRRTGKVPAFHRVQIRVC